MFNCDSQRKIIIYYQINVHWQKNWYNEQSYIYIKKKVLIITEAEWSLKESLIENQRGSLIEKCHN